MINKLVNIDLTLTKSKLFPAAGASNTSDVIDLGCENPGRTAEGRFELFLQVPATPNLANTKKITITIEDSADNATFAPAIDLPAVVITGVGVAGGPAVDRNFTPPHTLRRYIRFTQAVEAVGGDNTALSGTVGCVF